LFYLVKHYSKDCTTNTDLLFRDLAIQPNVSVLWNLEDNKFPKEQH